MFGGRLVFWNVKVEVEEWRIGLWFAHLFVLVLMGLKFWIEEDLRTLLGVYYFIVSRSGSCFDVSLSFVVPGGFSAAEDTIR
jgi:hypothetical protein